MLYSNLMMRYTCSLRAVISLNIDVLHPTIRRLLPKLLERGQYGESMETKATMRPPRKVGSILLANFMLANSKISAF